MFVSFSEDTTNMSTQLTLVICRGYSCNKTSPFVLKESVYIWTGTAKARRFISPAGMENCTF